MLPNIDGYSLCRTIRGLFPKLPVIFLTAKTETADLAKGFECGGTDYIRKLRNYFLSDPSIEIITLKGSGYIFSVP
jgi:DNA-binding response OmpR family regulator